MSFKLKKGNLSIAVSPISKVKSYLSEKNGTFSDENLQINSKGLTITGSPTNLPKPREDIPIEDISELKQLEVLGTGSTGTVKRALHIPTTKICALKIIPMDLEEEIRKKILLELRTLHSSYHPSIVTFFGAFYTEGSIFIALEYMDAGTLLDLVHLIGTIPENVLSKIAHQLMKGIGYLHKELHIIHRDIKPANLLLNQKGEVKITDFGVSGKLEETFGKKQTFVGTVMYMSPERIKANHHSSNSDIWSLGLSLLECAIGYYPYSDPPVSIPSQSQHPVKSTYSNPSLSSSPSKYTPSNPHESDMSRTKTMPNMTFFQLLDDIVKKPSPTPPSNRFSKHFCAFISDCLQKDPDLRPDVFRLMEYTWIRKSEKDSLDLASWLRQTLSTTSNLAKTL